MIYKRLFQALTLFNTKLTHNNEENKITSKMKYFIFSKQNKCIIHFSKNTKNSIVKLHN
jgi:hypothetical protein